MPILIQIGIIGYRKHARKLISLVDENQDADIKYIFHPDKIIEDERGTNDFSKLLACNAIIISSPNETHFKYLTLILEKFKGYIFCEKPPVTELAELKKLEELHQDYKNRIFFNFMFRFSELNRKINLQKESKEIGDIIHTNIVITKGLAFKKEYKNSWRADGNTNLHNLLDATIIHFIDLMNLNFGALSEIRYFPSLISKNGTSFDTAYIFMKYKNGKTVSILNSYASPLVNEISILGTNGYFTVRDGKNIIYSPRDTFDERGYFTDPPKISEEQFNIDDDVSNSLRSSMEYFIEQVKNNNKIEPKFFEASIETNQAILKLKDNPEIIFE
jgi:predicted dehydrogenase